METKTWKKFFESYEVSSDDKLNPPTHYSEVKGKKKYCCIEDEEILDEIPNGIVKKLIPIPQDEKKAKRWFNRTNEMTKLRDFNLSYFVIQKEIKNEPRNTHKYTYVKSIEEVEYFSTTNGNYYFTLLKNQPRRLYFDIEFITTQNDNEIIESFKEYVSYILKESLNFYVSSSCGKGEFGWWKDKPKSSYHIVIGNKQFRNHSELDEFFEYFDYKVHNPSSEYEKSLTSKFFWIREGFSTTIYDVEVYRETTHLRMINNSKVDSIRILKPIEDNYNYVNHLLRDDKEDNFFEFSIPSYKKTSYIDRRLRVPSNWNKIPIDDSLEELVYSIAGHIRQPRTIWLNIGRAIKSIDAELFELWVGWTLQQEKYSTQQDKDIKTEQMSSLWDELEPLEKSLEFIQRLSNKSRKEYKPFDMKDDYCFADFFSDYHEKEFQSIQGLKLAIIPNLKRVFACVEGANNKKIFKESPENLFIENTSISRLSDINFWVNVQEEDGNIKKKRISLFKGKQPFINSIVKEFLYRGTCFIPYSPMKCPKIKDKYLNYYAGMKAELVDKVDINLITPILNHIRIVWCRDDAKIYKYVLDWLSHIMKTPWKKTNVCICLYTEKHGSGKTSLIDFLRTYVIGEHLSAYLDDFERASARFNAILENKIFINFDEPKSSSSRADDSVFEKLKGIITARDGAFEKKGKDLTNNTADYSNYFITGNSSDMLRLAESDRRYLCLEGDERYIGNEEYFDKLYDLIDNPSKTPEVANHFYTFLFTRDSDSVLHVPMTDFKKEIITASYPHPIYFLKSVSENKKNDVLPKIRVKNEEGNYELIEDKRDNATEDELYKAFLFWCEENKIKHYQTRAKFISIIKSHIKRERNTSRCHTKDKYCYFFREISLPTFT